MTLEERVAELERRLDGLGDEVRTRRLVVVDPDGFKRLYTTHSIDAFDLTMVSKLTDRRGDPTAQVYLYVSEEGGDEEHPTAIANIRVQGDQRAVELGADAETASLAFETVDDDDKSRVLTGPWQRVIEERIEALRRFVGVVAATAPVVGEQYDALTE